MYVLHIAMCLIVYVLYSAQNEQVPPQITLPYQPPDVCAIRSLPEDGGASQLMYSTVAIIFLALMAMLF